MRNGSFRSPWAVRPYGAPVGMVGAEALLDGIRTGRSGDPVATVMDYVAVHVDNEADTGETLRQFRQAAWDWLRA
jgi:hypothetical protein